LTKKLVNAGSWAVIGQFTKLIFKFGLNLILANILTPKEFGLLGMVSVIIVMLNTLLEFGLFSSLIQKKDVSQKDLSSVFWITLIIGFVISTCLFFLAPLVANFYNEPALLSIVEVISIIFLFNSIVLTHNVILTKELNFKTLEVYSTVSFLISSIIALIFAYFNFGVWSLVIQLLSNSVLYAIFIWVSQKWRPSYIICFQSLKRLLNFGVKVFSSSILNTIFSSLDSIVIGKFFSASSLGFYSFAQNLINIPLNTFTAAVIKVLYPFMSDFQEDDLKLKNTYKTAINILNLLVIPIMGTVAIFSLEIITVLFGDKWLEMVPYVQLFAVISIFYPMSALNINLLLAKGRADKFLTLEIIKKALLLIAIFVGFKFGILGILYGILFISIIGLICNLYVSGKVSGYSIKDQLIDSIPIVFVSIIYLFLLNILKCLLIPMTSIILGSLSSLILSLLVLLLIIYNFNKEIVMNIKKIISVYK